MIAKVILIVLLMSLLGFSIFFLYQNWPGSPEELKIQNPNAVTEQGVSVKTIDYGKTMQFYPNMRFNHKHISYYIDSLCPEERTVRIEESFSYLREKIGIISFYTDIESEADILVGCSEDYLEQEGNMFIAGEGGPTEIINTSLYNIILKGKILLYRESKCEEPIVELHELLHVFGLDHSSNPKNILYNLSSCDQETPQEIVDTLTSLYSIEALPELSISNISATKKGRYLNFNIEIKNKGMIDANNVSLIILSEDKEVKSFDLGKIEFGGGKKLWAENLKLSSRSSREVIFIVDEENKVRELNEDNNKITLAVS